jgi:tRNA A-37 threonylcarbamoyl transferase component Bud32
LQATIPTEAGKVGSAKGTPPTHAELTAAFPQLEIMELIGAGGMGFVFKARQPKLDRLVALKILPRSLAADPAFAERFTREGRVLARLSHPNIVTIHDFGQASGFFYLLMEFVDGVNLRQAMKVGRFTPAQALAVVPKICEALQFAHQEGILHRDIKPENILLDSKGRVKIADFGIAKLLGSEAQSFGLSSLDSAAEGNSLTSEAGKPGDANLTEVGKAPGTPQYMAPEQLAHPQDVDHRADIYSLGVVFYEMLTGELPVGRFAPPSEKSTVDPRMDEVVLRALERERERRTQTAGEMKTQLQTVAIASQLASGNEAETGPEAMKPRQDWWTWSPIQAREVGEICAHFTKAERNHMSLLGLLCAAWIPGTIWGTFFLVRSNFGPGKWIVALVWLILLGVSIPMLQRFMRHFLCSTIWAREHGYAPERLRMFSFSTATLWKLTAVLVVGLVLIFAQNKAIVSYLGLAKWTRQVPEPATAAPQKKTLPEPVFGPVIERTINQMSTRTNFLISFATGLLSTPPVDSAGSNVDIPKWSARSGVDAGAGIFGTNVLGGFYMAVIPAPVQCWDELTPRQAVGRLDSLPLDSFGFISYGHEPLPFTCVFMTRQRGIGILQVTEYVSEPAGIKIRYKFVPEFPPLPRTGSNSPAAEDWSPTVWPGEKPNPSKVLDEARQLTEKLQYEQALQRYLWYHHHALEFETGQGGVHLSFALSDWMELGRRYPKALQALIEIRDRDVREFQEGRGYSKLFQDISSINEYLQEAEATYELYMAIFRKDKPLAGQCYFYAEKLLVSKGEYQICFDFMGDPQFRYDSMIRIFPSSRSIRVPDSTLAGSTNRLIPPPPDRSEWMKTFAQNRFIGGVCQLIEILVGTDHKAEAERIQGQAIAVLDDARLKSAVTDAEERVRKSLESKAGKSIR